MSLNLFLIQLVLITCFFLLLQAHRLPKGWFVAIGLVLGVLGGSFLVAPAWAGLISGSLWFLLIFLPLVGFAKVNHLVTQERFGRARRIAALLRWLHPADGFVQYPQLLRGLDLGQRGKLEQARQIFSRYSSNANPSGRMATALLYRSSAHWDELLKWVETSVSEKRLYKEVTLAATYLRSLGEVGDLNRLLQGVERLEQKSGRNSSSLNPVRLYALAFCGQLDTVQHLLDSFLAAYPPQTRQFWLATAGAIAGERFAHDQLEALSESQDAVLSNAARYRLSQSPAHPEQVLTDASKQILAQIKTAIGQETRYSYHVALAARKSYAAYALIGTNLLVFAVETLTGGSDDLYVLHRLGALIPEAVVAGEWWRSLTAIFLHSGVLHLTANMFGLYIFGALVEAALGRKKFLICYFFSGIGSMLTVTALAILTGATAQLTVGASGAVLGLVGAEGAIQLKGWRLEKAQVARDRLRLILLVVVLQVLSDLITPQVSLVGHVSGLILGFLAGSALFRTKSNQ